MLNLTDYIYLFRLYKYRFEYCKEFLFVYIILIIYIVQNFGIGTFLKEDSYAHQDCILFGSKLILTVKTVILWKFYLFFNWNIF